MFHVKSTTAWNGAGSAEGQGLPPGLAWWAPWATSTFMLVLFLKIVSISSSPFSSSTSHRISNILILRIQYILSVCSESGVVWNKWRKEALIFEEK